MPNLPYIVMKAHKGTNIHPCHKCTLIGQKCVFPIYIMYARILVHVEKYLHRIFFVNIFYQIANFYFAYFQRFTPYFQNCAKKSSFFCRIYRIFAVPLHSETQSKAFFLVH